MNKFTLLAFSSLMLIWSSCNDQGNILDRNKDKDTSETSDTVEEEENPIEEIAKLPTDFVPEEFSTFDKIFGDLNNDGQEDCILITKGTDPAEVVQDEYLGEMDRNRRGIIVLFKNGNSYDLAIKNDDCFSSENEDGGVYFPPELSIEIKKGKLYVHYAHGRYGSWKYTFRYQDNDFKLIGFDQTEMQGPVLHYAFSYNFLSGRKQTQENMNFYSENPSDEDIKETWSDLEKGELISLSSVEDFDYLSFD